jgi:hypothetical protein
MICGHDETAAATLFNPFNVDNNTVSTTEDIKYLQTRLDVNHEQ